MENKTTIIITCPIKQGMNLVVSYTEGHNHIVVDDGTTPYQVIVLNNNNPYLCAVQMLDIVEMAVEEYDKLEDESSD